jgi:hypothetical protein
VGFSASGRPDEQDVGFFYGIWLACLFAENTLLMIVGGNRDHALGTLLAYDILIQMGVNLRWRKQVGIFSAGGLHATSPCASSARANSIGGPLARGQSYHFDQALSNPLPTAGRASDAGRNRIEWFRRGHSTCISGIRW